LARERSLRMPPTTVLIGRPSALKTALPALASAARFRPLPLPLRCACPSEDSGWTTRAVVIMMVGMMMVGVR
jgi:hypothetical protein